MIKQSTKDQVEGTVKELKGKVKKEAGRALNRPDIANRGAAEEISGKVQKKVGQVEKVFNQ
jgi:uncharacterized protein YjbJ (UPF0337 family)